MLSYITQQSKTEYHSTQHLAHTFHRVSKLLILHTAVLLHPNISI